MENNLRDCGMDALALNCKEGCGVSDVELKTEEVEMIWDGDCREVKVRNNHEHSVQVVVNTSFSLPTYKEDGEEDVCPICGSMYVIKYKSNSPQALSVSRGRVCYDAEEDRLYIH